MRRAFGPLTEHVELGVDRAPPTGGAQSAYPTQETP